MAWSFSIAGDTAGLDTAGEIAFEQKLASLTNDLVNAIKKSDGVTITPGVTYSASSQLDVIYV